jgi:hypothetical protein
VWRAEQQQPAIGRGPTIEEGSGGAQGEKEVREGGREGERARERGLLRINREFK